MDNQNTPSGQPMEDSLDRLREYLRLLRRQWWLIALTLVLATGTAIGASLLQTPVYESSVQVLLEPLGDSGDDRALRDLIVGPQEELATQGELITSVPVAMRVIEDLGLDTDADTLLGRVDTSVVGDTRLLEVTVTHASAEQAAVLAQSFAESYLSYRRDLAQETIGQQAGDLDARIEAVRERLTEMVAAKQDASPERVTALEQEEQALLGQLAQLAAERASLHARSESTRRGGQIVRPAVVPDEPTSPQPFRDSVLGVVVGLVLGVGWAFLRDFLDDSIRSDEEASRITGAPVIGHVPRWKPADKGERRLVTVIEPASPVAEAYRTLRTNLRFLSVDHPLGTLLVTSAHEGEGKTLTAANLAVATADPESRVLLVGADLRRPKLHEAFGIDREPGLSDVLAGDIPLGSALFTVGVNHLRIAASGRMPPNPSGLLGSSTMQRLTREMERVARLVIFDGPPVHGLADALEVAPKVDGVVLVVDVGRSSRRAVATAASKLRAVGANLVGVVLNRVDKKSDAYHYYGYYGHTGDGSVPDMTPDETAGSPQATDPSGDGEPVSTSRRSSGRSRRKSRRRSVHGEQTSSRSKG